MNRPAPPEGIIIDPDGLTAEQRTGHACVACQKRWPRPRHPIGALPDMTPVYACDDCAPALYRALEETAALAANRTERAAAAAAGHGTPAEATASSENARLQESEGAETRDATCLPPARGTHRTRLRRPSHR